MGSWASLGLHPKLEDTLGRGRRFIKFEKLRKSLANLGFHLIGQNLKENEVQKLK